MMLYSPSNSTGSKCMTFDIEQHMAPDRVKKPSLDDVLSASLGLLNSMMAKNQPCKNYGSHVQFLMVKKEYYDKLALINYDFVYEH